MIFRFLKDKFFFERNKELFIFKTGEFFLIVRKQKRPFLIRKKSFDKYHRLIRKEEFTVYSREILSDRAKLKTTMGDIEWTDGYLVLKNKKISIEYLFKERIRKNEAITPDEVYDAFMAEENKLSIKERREASLEEQKSFLFDLKRKIYKKISEEIDGSALSLLYDEKKSIDRKIQKINEVKNKLDPVKPLVFRLKKDQFPRKGLTRKNSLVIIGRNREENSQIFRKYKDKPFLFFHSGQGIPGATVILLKENPEPDCIQDAAVFAAVFSKAWGVFKKIWVDYAPLKNVVEIQKAAYSLTNYTSINTLLGYYISKVDYGDALNWFITTERRQFAYLVLPGNNSVDEVVRRIGNTSLRVLLAGPIDLNKFS